MGLAHKHRQEIFNFIFMPVLSDRTAASSTPVPVHTGEHILQMYEQV